MLLRLGALCLAVALPLISSTLFTMYPNARRISEYQRESGDRVDRGPEIERLISAGLWAFAVLIVLALVLLATGHLFRTAGRSRNRRRVTLALRNDGTEVPSDDLLREVSQRQSAPVADILAVLAGLGITIGPAALFLGFLGGTGFYANAGDIFAPYRGAAIGLTVASVLLLAVALLWNVFRGLRDLELRNAVLSRWPSLPKPKKLDDSDGAPDTFVPATVGPALSDPAMQPR